MQPAQQRPPAASGTLRNSFSGGRRLGGKNPMQIAPLDGLVSVPQIIK